MFHCFTGGPDEARRCLDLDAHLSFSGIVTFPSASELRDAARLCPDDRILVETDSPYLAPVPHRGRPNRPALVAVVGEAVARERGVEASELARLTSANASRALRPRDRTRGGNPMMPIGSIGPLGGRRPPDACGAAPGSVRRWR